MQFSIIIRTKNEEQWIGRCLDAIFQQSIQDFEIIVVDSGSSDETLSIVRKFPVRSLIEIDNFLPGKALNIGIAQARGEYIVAISAHCVPVTRFWLQELKEAIEFGRNDEIVAAYGRQIPIATSSLRDKRDLMNTFGLDFRVQEKDFFFHNANSIVKRKYLMSHPYDDTVTNVEDRIWAKEVIESGKKIAYTPHASVYHHHGLNHDNNELRMERVSSLIEPLYLSRQEMQSSNLTATATLIIVSLSKLPNLIRCLNQVIDSNIAKSIFVITNMFPNQNFSGVNFIHRDSVAGIDAMSIPRIIQYVRSQVQDHSERTDYYVFLTPKIVNRPDGLLESLFMKAQKNFLDVCFPAKKTFRNLWTKSANGNYAPVETNSSLRSKRNPQFEAYFSLGLVMSSYAAGQGQLLAEHVGILEIDFEPKLEEI